MQSPVLVGAAEGVPAVRSSDLIQDLRCALWIADRLMTSAEPTRHGRDLLINAELVESVGFLLRQAGELAGRLDARV